MSGFGAFLDGLVGGMERRRSWDARDQAATYAAEDRAFDAEDRATSREDRARRIANEDSDRSRRISRDAANDAWQNEQRTRTRTDWTTEDARRAEEEERAEGDRAALAAIFNSNRPQSTGTPPAAAPAPAPAPAPPAATATGGGRRLIQPPALGYGGPAPAPAAAGVPALGFSGTAGGAPVAGGSGQDTVRGQAGNDTLTPVSGRFTEGFTALGMMSDARMADLAELADEAEVALNTATDPRNGRPLSEEATAQARQIISDAEQALSEMTSRAQNDAQPTQASGPVPPPPLADPTRPPMTGATGAQISGFRSLPTAAVPPRVPAAADPVAVRGPMSPPRLADAAPQATGPMPPPRLDAAAPPVAPTGPRVPPRDDVQTRTEQPPGMPLPPVDNTVPPANQLSGTLLPDGVQSPFGDRRLPVEAQDAAPSVAGIAEPASPAAAAETAQAAIAAATETPSGAIGAEVADAASRSVPPSERGRGVLDDQTAQTVGDNFVSRYNQDGMDAMMDRLLSQGRIEEAQQFRQFMEDEYTQQAMHSFGRAQAAAAMGDTDRFMQEIATIYNAPRYYDDGYSVILDQSNVERDEAGSVTNVRMAFRNDDTGEVFMREVGNENEFYAMALGLAAPESVFETLMSNYQQSTEAARTSEQAWAALQAPDNLRDMFEFFFEQNMRQEVDPYLNPDAQAFADMPPEEQADIVSRQMEAQTRAMRNTASGNGRSVAPPPQTDVPVAISR